jgi:inosine triphosphate pyrophosphatase
MHTFTVVTGNENKLRELQRLLPEDYAVDSVALDLDEIQSFDSEVIVRDKAARAYAELQRPVLVEDVSAGLENLNGLPGPFIKYFEQRLGRDVLYKLAGADTPATVSCTMCYYDGEKEVVVSGIVKGMVVKPRVMSGFGFDCVFVPEGEALTFAEMTPEQKDMLSHRAKAVEALVTRLSNIS